MKGRHAFDAQPACWRVAPWQFESDFQPSTDCEDDQQMRGDTSGLLRIWPTAPRQSGRKSQL
jgi:hypothetical protein